MSYAAHRRTSDSIGLYLDTARPRRLHPGASYHCRGVEDRQYHRGAGQMLVRAVVPVELDASRPLQPPGMQPHTLVRSLIVGHLPVPQCGDQHGPVSQSEWRLDQRL